MKWYKTEIAEDLRIEEFYVDDSNSWIVEDMKEGRYKDYIPMNEIEYNFDVTFEEFDEEYKKQINIIKEKLKDIEEYFDKYKGKILKNSEYSVYKYGKTSVKHICDIPKYIEDEGDYEELNKIVNFKLDSNVVYLSEPYLDDDIEYDGDTCYLNGIDYVINVFEFDGLNECQIKDMALKLAAYNKVGKICNFYKVTPENYKLVEDGDLTMKGFIKTFLVIRDTQSNCF